MLLSKPTIRHGLRFPHDLSNFQKCWNDAGMLLKTKERCGKPAKEAGMSMKTKELSA
jgi:hypothetical protein